jgi:acyl-CoA hydrolase
MKKLWKSAVASLAPAADRPAATPGAEAPAPALPPAEVHLDDWVAPRHTDERGHLRAGQMLEWMDVVGVLAAARHTRRPVVTASIDAVELAEPVRLGERVTMTATVAFTSARSLGVAVTMTHAHPGAPPRPTLAGYMTFVSLDESGKPSPVPQLLVDTPAASARFREGLLRREFRAELEAGQLPPRRAAPRTPADTPRARDRHDSYVHTIEPVRGGALNFHGTLYGGTAMRWLESNAQLSARAHLGGAPVRCTSLSGLTFLEPVRGHVFVHLRSMVVHVAGGELTVLVTIDAEDPVSGALAATLRAFLSYAPAEAGQAVPPVECASEAERALAAEVEERRALRERLAGASGAASVDGVRGHAA